VSNREREIKVEDELTRNKGLGSRSFLGGASARAQCNLCSCVLRWCYQWGGGGVKQT
jgi:hypothetical protein